LIEVQAVSRRNHDLAVQDALVRQPGEQRVVQFGEISIERPQVATLDENIGVAAKHNRAKAVPFRFVEESAAGWELVG
jgi:hypothetical protein